MKSLIALIAPFALAALSNAASVHTSDTNLGDQLPKPPSEAEIALSKMVSEKLRAEYQAESDRNAAILQSYNMTWADLDDPNLATKVESFDAHSEGCAQDYYIGTPGGPVLVRACQVGCRKPYFVPQVAADGTITKIDLYNYDKGIPRRVTNFVYCSGTAPCSISKTQGTSVTITTTWSVNGAVTFGPEDSILKSLGLTVGWQRSDARTSTEQTTYNIGFPGSGMWAIGFVPRELRTWGNVNYHVAERSCSYHDDITKIWGFIDMPYQGPDGFADGVFRGCQTADGDSCYGWAP
ncbi:hypothetical protein HDU97_006288 [Phlyctochytrium planicorne]|nr:hypothetical protein HDU97_006288 [Phlyctochytrium planicorne]